MRLNRLFLEQKHIPWLLAWVVVLSYGIYIFGFGFYGDDWSYIYYHHLLGFGGPGDFAATDRPLSALFYNPVIAVLGETPLGYHVLLLVLRWLSAFLFYKVMCLVWAGKWQQVAWMAVLFAVYPGFRQQPIAVEFILHFFNLDVFLFSLLAMVWAIRSPSRFWLWMGVSWIACAGVFMMEYFVGLEVLRPLLLWYVISSGKDEPGRRKSLRLTIRYWLPYIAVLGAFLVWRVFVFKFPTYQPSFFKDFGTAPLDTVVRLLRSIVSSYKTAGYNGWRLMLSVLAGLDQAQRKVYFFLIVLGALTTFFAFWRIKPEEKRVSLPFPSVWKEWGWQPLALGLVMVFAGGWPFWLTNIPIEASFPWDRSLLPFIPGVCVLTVGLVELVVHIHWRKVLLAVMVGLAVGTHFANALVYRAEWENLRQMFWQFAWRAPNLERGTILMSSDIPLYRVSDNGLTSPLNWMYAPQHSDRDLPYKFFDLDLRLGEEYTGLPGLEKDLPVTHHYRSLFFSSTTSHCLVFFYRLGSCVHILSPEDAILPGLPQKVVDTLPLSNLAMIRLNAESAARPPVEWGGEPEHGWCYYFQQADLARQKQDWNTVIALGDQAFEKSLYAVDRMEYRPFIEGYAHAARWQQARDLSLLVYEDALLRPALCLWWKKIYTDLSKDTEAESAIREIVTEVNCPLES
ncbi:MAG: hypothetical protein HPY45_06060 [Anaerolineae bacterium]|nr:hypothetical protein [Anaerolineae bacterium]